MFTIEKSKAYVNNMIQQINLQLVFTNGTRQFVIGCNTFMLDSYADTCVKTFWGSSLLQVYH